MRNFPQTMNVGERLNVCLWFSNLCDSSADLVQVSVARVMQWYQ